MKWQWKNDANIPFPFSYLLQVSDYIELQYTTLLQLQQGGCLSKQKSKSTQQIDLTETHTIANIELLVEYHGI